MFLDPFRLPSQKVSLYTKIRRFVAKHKKDESAGAIVYFKQKSRILFLLIKRGGFYSDWIFPKGGIEKGESKKATTLREIEEETNLSVKIQTKLQPTSYSFYWDPENKKITKTVYWFLAESKSKNASFAKNPEGESEDFEQIKWVDLETAIKLVKHQSEKDLLKEAGKILKI